jgi:ABC-2 type transport system permease protein
MSTTSTALTIDLPVTPPAPRQLPTNRTVFLSLLKADLTTQWRNRRASVMVVLVPIVIVMAWKFMIPIFGGAFVIANAITLGLNAIGLMGYTNSIARDREKDIFQRLRVTPAANWTIMGSRLTVQIVMITLMTIICMIVAYQFDHITLPAISYLAGILTAICGGALYLALGQTIVGLIKNPETVNATSRLIYIGFIMVGIFSETHAMGDFMFKAIKYTPYGAVETIVGRALTPSSWNKEATVGVLLTLGYTIVFAYLGIKWFKWSAKK